MDVLGAKKKKRKIWRREVDMTLNIKMTCPVFAVRDDYARRSIDESRQIKEKRGPSVSCPAVNRIDCRWPFDTTILRSRVLLQAGRPEPPAFTGRPQGIVAGREPADFQHQLCALRRQLHLVPGPPRPERHLDQLEDRSRHLGVAPHVRQHHKCQLPDGPGQSQAHRDGAAQKRWIGRHRDGHQEFCDAQPRQIPASEERGRCPADERPSPVVVDGQQQPPRIAAPPAVDDGGAGRRPSRSASPSPVSSVGPALVCLCHQILSGEE